MQDTQLLMQQLEQQILAQLRQQQQPQDQIELLRQLQQLKTLQQALLPSQPQVPDVVPQALVPPGPVSQVAQPTSLVNTTPLVSADLVQNLLASGLLPALVPPTAAAGTDHTQLTNIPPQPSSTIYFPASNTSFVQSAVAPQLTAQVNALPLSVPYPANSPQPAPPHHGKAPKAKRRRLGAHDDKGYCSQNDTDPVFKTAPLGARKTLSRVCTRTFRCNVEHAGCAFMTKIGWAST